MKPLLSVVIPTSGNPGTLEPVLEALTESDLPKDCWELVVVDDGASQATVAIASKYADSIVKIGGRPHGPSYARNRGAEVATGEVIVFVDADVCVGRDTLRRFAWAFLEAPETAAVYGAYDSSRQSRGLVSEYRDLLNHHIHHRGRDGAQGFWADCGAVRRDAFFAVGMFDEWLFSRPQIEALELGRRLSLKGYRIEYRPEIHGSHLKRWTLAAMINADLQDRGVPRSRIMERPGSTEGVGLGLLREPVAATLAWLGLIVALGGLVASQRWLGVVAATLAGGVLLLDFPIFQLFRRRRGLVAAIAIIPLHLLHHLVSGVALVLGYVLRHSVGDPQPSATVQAFSEVGVVKWPPVPRQVDRSATPTAPPPSDRSTGT